MVWILCICIYFILVSSKRAVNKNECSSTMKKFKWIVVVSVLSKKPLRKTFQSVSILLKQIERHEKTQIRVFLMLVSC
jgi:hypothetical protein